MATPERKTDIPEVSQVLWRVRYETKEMGKHKKLPWYQTTSVEELEALDPEALTDLQKSLLQQKEDITSGALTITCPTAYTDGRLSHVHRIAREYFEIPNVLSPGKNEVTDAQSVEVEPAPEYRATVGNRIAGLLGLRRHDENQ